MNAKEQVEARYYSSKDYLRQSNSLTHPCPRTTKAVFNQMNLNQHHGNHDHTDGRMPHCHIHMI